jgi:hypothetical protein
MPADTITGGYHSYDQEKSQEMLLDVAETILGWNVFSREGLGFRRRPRRFLEEIKEEWRQEILREIITLEEEVE